MKLPDGPWLPSLFQTIHLIAQPTGFLETCARRYGDPFTVRVLGLNSPPVLFLSNSRTIQELFAMPAKQFDFSKATHVFQPLMGHSVILQEGHSHQRQRQLLMPPFHGDGGARGPLWG